MGHKFAEIAFSKTVRRVQEALGSRSGYSGLDEGPDYNCQLSSREKAFIQARDSFYMASVGETGWPYIQHRGGPIGFLKVLDDATLGFADYSGNRQYVTTGNVLGNNRVAVFLMDYPNQRRLKILGRVELIESSETSKIARFKNPGYRAKIERGMIIHVEAFDWNCPQHITPRFSQSEVSTLTQDLRAENKALQERLKRVGPSIPNVLGSGELEVVLSGVRLLAEGIRGYELRHPQGGELPEVSAGAHIEVPILSTDGYPDVRRYSIASNSRRRDVYEIAVQAESNGTRGSLWIHENYRVGDLLRISNPRNFFKIAGIETPCVLVAGGIGITPIKAMAQALDAEGADFHLHYAGRKETRMAYLDRLQREFGDRLSSYIGERDERLDVSAILSGSPRDAEFYVCGPVALIEEFETTAARLGIGEDRVHSERFADSAPVGRHAFELTLARSHKVIQVPEHGTVLDAILDAGVELPSSCRVGQCRTCVAKVLSGQVDHRDKALSKSEQQIEGLMCPCVSWAKSKSLTLDL